MAQALIMAGGASKRMHASGQSTHKALIEVLGVPLLERNLMTLLAHGLRDIAVSCSVGSAVQEYVEQRGRALVRSQGGTLSIVTEKKPLGNVGAARAVKTSSDALLMIYVDNLTTVDLHALIDRHRASNAALTIAPHRERFSIAFGELILSDGLVDQYIEKPDKHIQVSSGMYVLSRKAIDFINIDESLAINALFLRLKKNNELIAAYEHNEPWIDVNDAAALARAEELVFRNNEAFEQWPRSPDEVIVHALVLSPDGVMVVVENTSACQWGFPHERMSEMANATSCYAEALAQELGLRRISPPTRLGDFIEIDLPSGRVLRHYGLLFHIDSAQELKDMDRRAWMLPKKLTDCHTLTAPAKRLRSSRCSGKFV